MRLVQISISNFRCFETVENVPIHKLTVFIGENDAGKTMFLSALELLLTDTRPKPADYRMIDADNQAEMISISGSFEVEDHDEVDEDIICPTTNRFVLTKKFTLGSIQILAKGMGYSDLRWNSFERQTAAIQRELLESLALNPGRNNEVRLGQMQKAVEDGLLSKVPMNRDIRWQDIQDVLPLFYYTSSVDYKRPDSMIQRTMQRAVDSCLRPKNAETGEQKLLPELKRVERKIKDALNQEIDEIKDILKRANPKIQNIQVSPTVDFNRSVSTTNIMLDLGEGLQFVDAFGEGTKKKLWLGLLDWERDVERDTQEKSVVRAYDEPDVNLDYEAKRKLFANILDDTKEEGSFVQSIICTHEVTMIDHAPANSINLIRTKDDGSREIEFLRDSGDESVRQYLAMLSRSAGIRNSAVFYEKAFIIVEGESEEAAFPILYQNMFGHSYVQDRIQLINLRTCGAWKSVLHILLANRADISVMLLDSDCTEPQSSGYVTDDVLTEIGYPDGWKDDNVFYIGAKEYEDAFRSEDIVSVLNEHWPKNGSDWEIGEVDAFRDPTKKFSSDLLDHVRRTCIPHHRNSARKPDFAEKLAVVCTRNEQIPSKLRELFDKARELAGTMP